MDDFLSLLDIALIILAYLLGSVPFGLVVAKMAGVGDLRAQGSKNIGATNMLRVSKNKRLGAVVLLLDGAKGALAVGVARWLSSGDIAALAAASAVLGHMFPLWLKFKGGKGVATSYGVLLGLSWPVGVLSLFTWILVFYFSRISSLSALLSMIATPTFALLLQHDNNYGVVYLSLFLTFAVVARHHENLRRLLRGEEGKL